MSGPEEAEVCDSLLLQIRRYAAKHLPLAELLRLDEQSSAAAGAAAADALGEQLGVRAVFLPSGPGTSMENKYRVAEALGRVDLGIATSLLATLLALDP